MDHGRCVVSGVPAVEGAGHHRVAEVALPVAFTDAGAYGSLQVTAGDLYALAKVHEDDGEAGVLAHGDLVFGRKGGVFEEARQDLAADGGLLPVARGLYGRDDVGRKHSAGPDAEFADPGRDVGCCDFLHTRASPLPHHSGRRQASALHSRHYSTRWKQGQEASSCPTGCSRCQGGVDGRVRETKPTPAEAGVGYGSASGGRG